MREQLAEIRDEFLKNQNEEEPVAEEPVAEEPEEGTEEVEAAEEEFVEYFNDLPEVLGVEADDFYALKLKTDTGNSYTWSEVKDILQAKEKGTADYENKAQELAERERQMTEQFQQTAQQSQATSAEVQQATQELSGIHQLYTTLLGQLDDLNNSGDTESSMKVQAELLKLQQAYTNTQQKLSYAQQQATQQQQNAYNSHLAKQRGMLETLLPDWREPEGRKKKQAEMREYLQRQGLSPQEISAVSDARLVVMIDKAQRWDKHMKNVSDTSDKVRNKTIRRIVKGSNPSPKGAATRNKQIIDRGSTSSSEKDKRAAFRAIAENAGLL